MTDYPTVGLAVDLSGIDAGDKAYADLQKRIEGVADAAEVAGKKVTTSLRGQTAARGEAAQAAGDQAAAEARAGAATSKADAAATKQQEANRRYLQQVRINSIQMEEAARRAAQAIELQEANRQAAALIAADRAATAEAERNRKYLLQVRLNSFKMEETAGQKAALAQVAADNEAYAAAVAKAAELEAARRAANSAPSQTAQVAAQVNAQVAADLAEAKAMNLRTVAATQYGTARRAVVATDAAAISSIDKIVAAYARQNGVTIDAARAVLNASTAFKGMAPPLAEAEVAVAGVGRAMTGTSLKVREFLVMIREAIRGDFTRFAGSASIMAGAFGLLTGSVVATAAVIIAAAAPFIALAVAMAQGAGEAAKLSNALEATHDAVGLTRGQIEQSAAAISKAMDYSQGKTLALMTHLVESGKVNADTLGLVTTASIKLSQLTGEAADKIADKLVGALDDAAKAAAELNERYHFLTLAQYDQIEALEKAGDKQGAFTLLLKDLNSGVSDATVNMGYFEAAIHRVGTTFGQVWADLKNFGKDTSVEEKLKKAQDNLKDLTTPGHYELNSPDIQSQIAQAQAKVKAFSLQAVIQKQFAAGDARTAQTQAAGIAAHRDLMGIDSSLGGSKARMLQEIADYKAKVAAALKANPADQEALADRENMAARIAAIAKKYDKTDFGRKPHNPFEGALDQIGKMKAAITGLEKEIDNISADPLSVMSAQITAAGNAAAAALESGDKKNQALADKQRALAEEKERLTLIKAMIQASASATRQNQDQAASEAILAKAQLDSTNIMKAFWGGGTTTLEGYSTALAKSRQVVTDAAVAQSDLSIAQRYGVKDLDDIAQALVDAKVANADYAQQVEDAAKVEAAAAAERIRQKAALDALASKDTDLQAFNATSYDQAAQTLNHMKLLADNLGNSLAAGFGKGGTALQKLMGIMTAYTDKQLAADKQIADAKAKYDVNGERSAKSLEVERQANEELAQARVEGYADMAAAAADFFGKNTLGYEVMKKAEMAFRLVEFAMSAKSIIIKTVETAAKVGLFGAQAQAAATAGAANMFATMGPAAFVAVAAMLAVLAGLGFVATGGGSAPVSQSAPRQAAQGTGSILGDATAKSDSIARSLEIVASNTNKDLEFSNSMLTALKSIDANISSLVAAIARELQVGGALDTSGLGLGSSSSGPGLLTRIFSPIANLLPGLFGSKTTTTLQDQGLSFGPQSVGSIVSGGIQGSTYADLAAETKKQFLGITYSDKTKNSTVTAGLDSQLQGDLTRVVASLRDGVLSAATVLGVDGAKATLDALVLNLGTVSLKDLKGADLTAAISAIFSKAGDDMAAAVLPMVSEFQKAGEGAMETLVRLARDYQVLDVSLSSIGKTFGAVGVSSLAARERLIDLAGGIDTLNSQVSDYASKFLTDGERMAPVITAVYTALGKLGDGSITTKAQFKQLVDSLDLTTASGAQTFATLMQIAPAFSDVVDYLDGLKTASQDVTDAQGKLNDAYNTAAGLIQDTRDKFQGFVDAFKAFKQQLNTGPLAALSPQDQYLRSQELYRSTQAAAAGGDPQAMSNLQSVSEAYLQASKDYYASTEPYFKDLAEVKAGIDAAQAVAQHQVDAAQQQLDALDKMVSGLITLNTSVLSVADAIQAVQAAIGSLAAAQAAQAAAQASAAAAAQAAAQAAATPPPVSSGGTPPSTPPPANDNASGGVDYNQLLAARPDVMAEYNRLIATADRNSPWFSQHGLDQGPAGFAQWWYTQGGGSASYSAHAMSAAASLDSAAPLDTAAPAAPTATIASAPSAAAGGDGSAAIVAALGQLTEQVQINNVLAKAGHTGTIDKLGDLVDETIGLRTTIRAQAA